LPKTLEEAYETILSKSPDEDMARKLLHIVLCAGRPMTLAEMNIALNVTDDCKTTRDIDCQETDESLKTEIRNLCGLFLSVVDSKIYLIHQTAKEFLLFAQKDTQDHSSTCDSSLHLHWKSKFLPDEGNQILTQACVSYLHFSEFQRDLESARSDYIFLDYSAKFWALHFREAKLKDHKSKIAESALALCDISSKRCQLWYDVFETSQAYAGLVPKLYSSLALAAYLGHTLTVDQLLFDRGTQVDPRDEYGKTPLSLAAREGHEAVVLLLLDKGAQVDPRDEYGWTPLSLAVNKGHEAVVRLLVEKGAEVDTKDEDRWTPLSLAAREGHEAVVRLLVEKGAEVDTKDEDGWTPLSLAAREGHEAVVGLLVERGAEVDTKDKYGWTPLSLAAMEGHEAVVRLLLEKGA
jgi:hypothetical protein